MKNKVKKSNAGRKPVPDKKVQVSLYVLSSQIEKLDELEEKMSLALSEHFDVKKEEISLIDKKLNVDFHELYNQQVWYIINGEQRLVEVGKTWIY